MEIMLDTNRLLEPEDAHAYLAERLNLPDYYGSNLDALYDCLTEIGEETQLVLKLEHEHKDEIYLKRLLRVMKDAEDENPFLSIVAES